MAVYEFKCKACGARAQHDGKDGAARAGWLVAEIWFGEGVRYTVACPQCVPAWARASVNRGGADGKRSGGKG